MTAGKVSSVTVSKSISNQGTTVLFSRDRSTAPASDAHPPPEADDATLLAIQKKITTGFEPDDGGGRSARLQSISRLGNVLAKPITAGLFGGAAVLSAMTELSGDDKAIIARMLGEWSDEPRREAEATQAKLPSLAETSIEAVEALRTYVGSYYKTTNRELRSIGRGQPDPVCGNTIPPEDSAIIKGAAVALNHLPSVSRTVFRKEGGTGILLDAQPGSIVTDPGFLSTTLSQEVAEGWPGAALLVIHAAKNGHDVSQMSPFPNEQEVVFLPGTPFEVLRNEVDPVTGRRMIELRERT